MLAVWPHADVIQDSRTWPDSKLDRSSVITRSTSNCGLAASLTNVAICLRSACGLAVLRSGFSETVAASMLTINSLSFNYPLSSRSGTLLPILLLKLPKFCHITPILHSLHWLRITERIEYKLLWLTYKVFTTTQPPYFYKFISVQRPCSTHYSCVVAMNTFIRQTRQRDRQRQIMYNRATQ